MSGRRDRREREKVGGGKRRVEVQFGQKEGKVGGGEEEIGRERGKKDGGGKIRIEVRASFGSKERMIMGVFVVPKFAITVENNHMVPNFYNDMGR